MIMEWPQITWIILVFFGLLTNATKDGQPKVENYNFGLYLISAAIGFILLKCGGFFG